MKLTDYCYKIFISTLFISILIFVFSSRDVFAQASLSERWVCLKSIHCWEKKDESKDCIVKNGHMALLSAKDESRPLPNKDTYIVEALATANGEVRTAGTQTLDMKLFGKDNEAALNTSDGYLFQGLFKSDAVTTSTNPVKSKANGEIDQLYWQSYSKGNERKFLAMNYVDSIDLDKGTGGQQQATFTFEGAAKKCISISWDPYGLVFDSSSLEPVFGAQVELQKKRNNGQFTRYLSSEMLGGDIENPFTTKENGGFSFVVPDGTYRLITQQDNYIFPAEVGDLNANYINIYSDIYPTKTGEQIIQQGSIQHRDIPLKPKTGGISYSIKLMEYFYTLDKDTKKLSVEGIVSHPLSTIKLYSLKPAESSTVAQPVYNRYKLLKQITADKLGKFSVNLDETNFEPTEVFGDLEIEKPQIMQQKPISFIEKFIKLVGTVNAQQSNTKTVRFDPILNSIKGYAYDQNGKILANATVDVYFNFSDKPYFETKTDNQGLYEISSNNLPNTAYRLQYKPLVGQPQIITTSNFVAQNQNYLVKTSADKKITTKKPDYFAFENKNSLSQNSKLDKSQPQSSNLAQSNNKTNTLISNSSNNSYLLIFAIILFLIGGAGGLLVFYLIRKQRPVN